MQQIKRKAFFENAKALGMPTTGPRQKWLTMSTESPDRTGDVMVMAGMDATNFMKNPQFIWNHEMSGAEVNTIGKILQLQVTGNTLYALAEFAPAEINPLAEQIFQLSEQGYLPANSIGFCPIEYEINNETGGCTYTKWELVECSKVEIPMNPEAIDKSLHAAKTVESHAITLDVEEIQKSTAELVTKEGRTFAGKNETELRAIADALIGHGQGIHKMLDEAKPEEKTDVHPGEAVDAKPKKNFRGKLLRAKMLNSRIN